MQILQVFGLSWQPTSRKTNKDKQFLPFSLLYCIPIYPSTPIYLPNLYILPTATTYRENQHITP